MIDHFLCLEFLIEVQVQSAVHHHSALGTGRVAHGQAFGFQTLSHGADAVISRLALRSGEAAHAVAQHDGVHALTNLERTVSVDVKTGVDARAAFVAGFEGAKRFGFDQPGCGQGLFWDGVYECMVVQGEHHDGHQA